MIFEFKPWSSAKNNFSIPPKLTKKCNCRFPRPGTSDVMRCVNFDDKVHSAKFNINLGEGLIKKIANNLKQNDVG